MCAPIRWAAYTNMNKGTGTVALVIAMMLRYLQERGSMKSICLFDKNLVGIE
jgi:hypothetical protein